MTYIEDCLTPTKALMLVLEDPRSNILSVIPGVGNLERAEAYEDKKRVRSGVVKKVGPLASYKVGTRVLYSASAVTTLGGGAGRVVLVDSPDVDAYLDGEEDKDSEPSPSWEKHLRPPPGEAIVKRAEKPKEVGGIIVTQGYSYSQTRCMEAEVLARDEEDAKRGGLLKDFPVGHRVLLSPYACKSIQLDLRGECILSRLDPRQIMCHVNESPKEPVQFGRDYTGLMDTIAKGVDPDERFDEGDPAGPR